MIAILNQGKFAIIFLHDSNQLAGKTNQNGRREYGAAVRHRDYRSRLIGALAVSLFWRWHCSEECFPCFRTSEDWYRIKVLEGTKSILRSS